MKKTQRDMVINRLREYGFVSRNWALSQYCSRLGAIVCDLNASGWDIQGNWETGSRGKDFVYRMQEMPFKKVMYRVIDPKNGEHKDIVKYEKK